MSVTTLMSFVYKLADFFVNKDQKVFTIPAFQRIYLWTKKECKALWLDIIHSAETGKSHYLNAITRFSVDNEHEYITDGQQRLVSLALLGMAILDILQEENCKIKSKTEKEFLIKCAEKLVYSYPVSLKGKRRLKVALNKDDKTVIEAVQESIEKKGKKKYDEFFNEIKPEILEESHIKTNFDFFKIEIEKFVNKGGNINKIFEAINNIEVSVEDCPVGKAQVVYSNKNSKGLPMTQVDLVKNALMYMFPLENQVSIYEQYWLNIERNVFRKNMENFIVDSMAVINANSTKVIEKFAWDETKNLMQNMYEYMTILNSKNNRKVHSAKERPEDDKELMPNESIEILQALLDMSVIYKKYVTDVKTYKDSLENPVKNKVYEFYHIFGGKMGMSVILYLLKKYEDKEITEAITVNAINAMNVFQVRNKYVGQFKGVQRKPSIALMREMNGCRSKHLDDFLWNTLVKKAGTQAIASDESLLNYFNNTQLSSGFGNTAKSQKLATRYLFWRMNVAYAKDKHKTVDEFNQDYCVEHVIAPTNKIVWEKELNETDEDKMKCIVDRLGNHALVLKACDEDAFGVKRVVYVTLNFPLTNLIGKNKKYNEDNVNEMTALYAKYFIKAFPIPNKYKDKKK